MMKRKINCLVCDVTYADNNSNNPNHAIYLGVAQGREKLVDRPVFIHQQSSCIAKARKQNFLDKGGKFKNCIVCGHRINLSQKYFDGGGTIEPNGYLVDTNAWIHKPFTLKDKHGDLAIANCYEEAFGHSKFPPEDILSKRAEIIKTYVNRSKNPEKIEAKIEQKKIPTSIINEDQNNKDLYIQDLIQHSKEQKIKRIKEEKKASNIFNITLTGILLLLSYASVYFYGLNEFLYPGLAAGFLTVVIFSFVAIKIFDGDSYIVFFKKNFIAIIIASIILTNFYFLIGGGPGFSDRPCRVNAFACE